MTLRLNPVLDDGIMDPAKAMFRRLSGDHVVGIRHTHFACPGGGMDENRPASTHIG